MYIKIGEKNVSLDEIIEKLEIFEHGKAEVITPEILRDLSKYKYPYSISIYLDLSPQMRIKGGWKIVLKDEFKKLEGEVESETLRKVNLLDTLKRVERTIELSLPKLGRGVAYFIGEEERFFSLPLEVPNRVVLKGSFFIRPLVRLFDEYERILVLLLGKEHARFIISEQGILREIVSFISEDYVLRKDFGVKVVRIPGLEEAKVIWHVKAVTKVIDILLNMLGVNGFVLSTSTPEVKSELLERLSKKASESYKGDFSVSVTAPLTEVKEKITPLLALIERDSEIKVIDEFINSVPEKESSRGLESTLESLYFKKVYRFITRDPLYVEGYECGECGYLSTVTLKCPMCGVEMQEIHDIVEAALEQAILQNSLVELVRSKDAKEKLEKEGIKVGAILRF